MSFLLGKYDTCLAFEKAMSADTSKSQPSWFSWYSIGLLCGRLYRFKNPDRTNTQGLQMTGEVLSCNDICKWFDSLFPRKELGISDCLKAGSSVLQLVHRDTLEGPYMCFPEGTEKSLYFTSYICNILYYLFSGMHMCPTSAGSRERSLGFERGASFSTIHV